MSVGGRKVIWIWRMGEEILNVNVDVKLRKNWDGKVGGMCL